MRLSNRTQVNPLILNFMTPATPETVSASATPMYDPINQITWMMGGGGGTKRATRCNDGYKKTVEKQSGTATYEHNDAERYTDD